ncbi:cell wall-binding repeat-containing protein [Herbiconiux sp. CPCC 203407]|uniref:Cell wall-binding repeat-containing protein n=1 Tax=Herbiconiux oxytropis TaxID=2970915 RepID=A0AA41XFG5_9MICO|nr:cell wall-binding repeat-containing protein [Herbiconiux oxytropis]MCS5722969.1 cell wall-binding repeat-containing protein [Herbiconiux oxytropis]MCS5725219.1 cell wall-binding repeat-containing protein [Herbiconiux oxytropis]
MALTVALVPAFAPGWSASAAPEEVSSMPPPGAVASFPLPNPDGLPVALAAGADGTVWVGVFADKQVHHLARDGSVIATVQLTGGPSHMTSDHAGGVWVAEFAANTIGHVSAEGVVSEQVIPTANSLPAEVYDSGDYVFFTESASGKLGRLTKATGVIDEFVYESAEGIWDIDGIGDEVWVYDRESEFFVIFGLDGVKRDVKPGQGVRDFELSEAEAGQTRVVFVHYFRIDAFLVKNGKWTQQPGWIGPLGLNGVTSVNGRDWWFGQTGVGARGIESSQISSPSGVGVPQEIVATGDRYVWVAREKGRIERIDSFTVAAVSRIGGADRYEVAAAIATRWGSAETVFVASGQKFADALTVGALAGRMGIPLLLTKKDDVPLATQGSLTELTPSYVVIVGGAESVSAGALEKIASFAPGAQISRIGGADRYEVSRNLLDSVYAPPASGVLYIADGRKFPDALSAAPAATASSSVVLLVNGASDSALGPAERAVITKYATGGTIKVIGGPASMSFTVEAQLKEIAPVLRLGGADRYEVSEAVIRDAFPRARAALIASGTAFADALASAPLAERIGGPVYLSRADCLPSGSHELFGSLGIEEVTLVGGVKTLSGNVEDLIECR